MKIKVPKKIQYGCHAYDVFFKDETLDDYDGDAIHLAQEIRIRKALPPSRRITTFIHENLHPINKIYNCDLREEQIESLCEGLGQLLFSNMGIELDWSDILTKTAVVKPE